MKFQPKTEKEIAEEGLIPAGTICDFEVLEAEEKTSRAGNAMIALQLKVWRPNGQTTLVRDWLLLDQMWKLHAFCAAVDKLAEYEAGEIDPFELKGVTGRAKIGVKPASGDYPAGNSVQGYIKAEGAASPAKAAPAKAAPARIPHKVDDEIPF
jgi:hypothetical protein